LEATATPHSGVDPLSSRATIEKVIYSLTATFLVEQPRGAWLSSQRIG
jgi:hypothetical protein